MKCRDWDKRLPSLLDEPAGSPERLGLEAHLRQCDACRGSWELLGRLRAEAPRLGGLEPGERVWQGIEAAWAHPVPARAPVVRWWRPPALSVGWAAAAVLVAVLAAAWILQPRRPAPDGEPVRMAAVTRPQGGTTPAKAPAHRRSAVPARAAARPAPATGREYVADHLTPSDDAPAPDDGTRYLMPAVAAGGAGNDQQYIMPAVYIADREPF